MRQRGRAVYSQFDMQPDSRPPLHAFVRHRVIATRRRACRAACSLLLFALADCTHAQAFFLQSQLYTSAARLSLKSISPTCCAAASVHSHYFVRDCLTLRISGRAASTHTTLRISIRALRCIRLLDQFQITKSLLFFASNNVETSAACLGLLRI